MNKMNKKAALGSQTMIWLFILLLLIIGGGIVGGISMFFGSEYDFRKVDASLLNYKIATCIKENSLEFNEDLEIFEQTFYQTCQLNKEITKNNFFIFIEFSSDGTYQIGPGDRTQCALAEKNKNFPKCINTTIQTAQQSIFIETGSNQHSIKKRI